ncbi:dihydroneopterin aldolase (plasmid) [Cupriavidus basilensis]
MENEVGASEASLHGPTRKLFLRAFRCSGDSARPETAPTIVIDIEMTVPLHLSASVRDDIRDVVDYDIMRQAVCAAPKDDLQRLASEALQHLLAHPKVTAATVTARLEGNGFEGVTMSSVKADPHLYDMVRTRK